VFLGGCGVLLTCIAPIVLAPEWSTAAIGSLFGFLTQSHGIVYVCTAIATLTFLLYIAISEHGNVVLGGTGSPAYSTFSWASMLFCADIGAALIYWGAAEWVFYYTSPPFNVESRSEQAILLASSYPIFHWGPVGWTFYSLPTIALGCSYHVYKVPSLCLSAACHAVLGAQTERLPGRTIDLLFIIGLLDTNLTIPVSENKCKVIFDYYFVRTPEQNEDFKNRSIEMAHQVQIEDESICQSVQRGLSSRAYDVGRLSPEKEGGEQLFHRLLHRDFKNALPG